jgi:hypothetical protein
MEKTLDQLFAKAIPVPHSGCWVWLGHVGNDGYARVSLKRSHYSSAHRLAYMLAKGPIPEGLNLDHLCRVRCCINPDHLEPVTDRVNILRGQGHAAVNAKKTHCPLGHSYDPGNTFLNHGGRQRECLICRREQSAAASRKYRARLKNAVVSAKLREARRTG